MRRARSARTATANTPTHAPRAASTDTATPPDRSALIAMRSRAMPLHRLVSTATVMPPDRSVPTAMRQQDRQHTRTPRPLQPASMDTATLRDRSAPIATAARTSTSRSTSEGSWWCVLFDFASKNAPRGLFLDRPRAVSSGRRVS
jgi:hypothetical protein